MIETKSQIDNGKPIEEANGAENIDKLGIGNEVIFKVEKDINNGCLSDSLGKKLGELDSKNKDEYKENDLKIKIEGIFCKI